jgi:hypothetical protein
MIRSKQAKAMRMSVNTRSAKTGALCAIYIAAAYLGNVAADIWIHIRTPWVYPVAEKLNFGNFISGGFLFSCLLSCLMLFLPAVLTYRIVTRSAADLVGNIKIIPLVIYAFVSNFIFISNISYEYLGVDEGAWTFLISFIAAFCFAFAAHKLISSYTPPA